MTERPDLDPTLDLWTTRLLIDGYCVIPDLIAPDRIEALDRDLRRDFAKTPFGTGSFYGERTKRFGRLLARSRHAAPLIQNALVLGIAKRVLSPWCDCIQLNLTQAIAVHPGALAQMPHRDQDMWRGEIGRVEYLVNVMWPFTRYTRDNGATRVWRESHRHRALEPVAEAHEEVPELAPGSALLFLGSTLHAAGANRSGEIRRGMIAGYSLGWLKSYENQFLAYPPRIARRFTPELAALVGYRQHRPNLGNFEGCCPSILLESRPPARPGAVDALRPDQKAMVEEHAARQRGNLAA